MAAGAIEAKSMPRANLLNTSSQSLLELMGAGKIYRVPPYQRDYPWQEEQWEDLWSDVVELAKDGSARHYMGALVVEAASDPGQTAPQTAPPDLQFLPTGRRRFEGFVPDPARA